MIYLTGDALSPGNRWEIQKGEIKKKSSHREHRWLDSKLPARYRHLASTQIVPSRHLRDYVLDSQAAESVLLETSDHYRDQSYFPVIDRLLSELKRRVSSESSHALKGATAPNPKHKTFMDKDCLRPMAKHYGMKTSPQNCTRENDSLKGREMTG